MKLTKHKVRVIEGQEGYNVPDAHENYSYTPDEINQAIYLGSTADDHEVLRLASGKIAIVYSIDLDWFEE